MQLCDGYLMFRKMVYILGIVRKFGCGRIRYQKVFTILFYYLKVFYSLIVLSEISYYIMLLSDNSYSVTLFYIQYQTF